MQPFHELLAELVCGKLGQLAKLRLFAVAQRAQRARSESSSEAISLLVLQATAPWNSGAHRRAFQALPSHLQLFAVLAVARTGRGAPAAVGLHRCTKYAP